MWTVITTPFPNIWLHIRLQRWLPPNVSCSHLWASCTCQLVVSPTLLCHLFKFLNVYRIPFPNGRFQLSPKIISWTEIRTHCWPVFQPFLSAFGCVLWVFISFRLLINVANCWNRDTKVFGDGLVPFRGLMFGYNGTGDALRRLPCLDHNKWLF